MSGLSLALLSLSLFVVAIVLWIRFLNAVALEGRRSPLIAMCLISIVVGASAFGREPGWIGGAMASVGVLGGSLWIGLGLLRGQSRQVPNVVLGKRLPTFTAPDQAGEFFDIESLRGHPVLIKIFRGHW